jgi:hypothetical protein
MFKCVFGAGFQIKLKGEIDSSLEFSALTGPWLREAQYQYRLAYSCSPAETSK